MGRHGILLLDVRKVAGGWTREKEIIPFRGAIIIIIGLSSAPKKKAYKHIYEEHVHKHRQLSGREAEDYDVRIVWIFADF